MSRLKEIVEQIEYKPEAALATDGTEVVVAFTRPDAYGIRELATFTYATRFNDEELATFTDEQIVYRIFRAVRKLELHEAYEWFKYKGKRRVQVHPIGLKYHW